MLITFCADIECSNLTPPTNGIILYNPNITEMYAYQTRATYICSSGYGLSGGDGVRTCVGSPTGPGEWSETAPTCEGKRDILNLLSLQLHVTISQHSISMVRRLLENLVNFTCICMQGAGLVNICVAYV